MIIFIRIIRHNESLMKFQPNRMLTYSISCLQIENVTSESWTNFGSIILRHKLSNCTIDKNIFYFIFIIKKKTNIYACKPPQK